MQFDTSERHAESNVKNKRFRASNFTEREKNLLFSLVFKYRSVIENKKTHGTTIQEKKGTWDKITKQFNSGSPGLIPRSTESLKKCYDNRKKELRKDMAKERCELYKTGGGPPPPPNPKKQEEDLLLSIVNKKTICGLENPYDGDRCIDLDSNMSKSKISHSQLTPNNPMLSDFLKIISEKPLEINTAEITPIGNKKQRKHILNFNGGGEEDDFLTNFNNNDVFSDVLVSELDNEELQTIPINSITNQQHEVLNLDNETQNLNNEVQDPDIDKKQNQDNVRQNLMPHGRRRPATVVKALTSSNIAEKYEKLVDQRLLLCNYEITKTKSTVQQNDIEHKLRVQSLQLDIAIKEKQLQALQEI